MANNIPEEPKTAPQPDRWYNLSLGPSFKDESSNKFCTFRYEFKPASIDKTKPGWLKKTKENRVTVEFQNSQPGKPNLSFIGSSEDYKDNDAVLFFDGETFRLERLHRAVNQLRHLRQPGESAAAAATATATTTTAGVAAPAATPSSASVLHSLTPPEPRLSPPVTKVAKPMHMGRSSFPTMPVEVERIDIGEPGNAGAKPVVASKGLTDYSSDPPNASVSSPGLKNDDEHQDIDIDDIFGSVSSDDGNNAEEERVETGFDINIPHQNDTDDEIADVDDSGDEAEKGPNAAEALRAQVNAEGRAEQSSSSSSSGSGSGSSSGSSSASSDSEGSDEDSVTSI